MVRAVPVVWAIAEGYAQSKLYLPTGDADLFDHQPQKPLSGLEVEVVEAVSDPSGEVV